MFDFILTYKNLFIYRCEFRNLNSVPLYIYNDMYKDTRLFFFIDPPLLLAICRPTTSWLKLDDKDEYNFSLTCGPV